MEILLSTLALLTLSHHMSKAVISCSFILIFFFPLRVLFSEATRERYNNLALMNMMGNLLCN